MTFLKNRRSKGGMTLVEVLLVVVILAVLAAIIMPNMAIFRRRGLVNSAKATMALIHSAGMMYRSDNRVFPPAPTGTGTLVVDVNHPLIQDKYLQEAIASREWAYTTIATAGQPPQPPTFTVRATGRAGTAVSGFDGTYDGARYAGTPADTW